jgi:ADP-heptose:LPS heptosyltransferase
VKILVARPDRLGDLLISTPVFRALKKASPNAVVFALVKRANFEVLEGNPDVDGMLEFDEGRHSGIPGAVRLSKEIAKGGYDASVSLFTRYEVALALRLAGVRTRIGPGAKLHSYILYNHCIRQDRSKCDKHEAEYNLELLKPLGVVGDVERRTYFHLTAEEEKRGRDYVAGLAKGNEGKTVAVHPGMGGSAKNWSMEKYAGLVRMIAGKGARVLLTGLENERGMLERLRSEAGVPAGIETGVTLRQLASIYKACAAFFGPSTGPMHLANAVGTPVVCVYSPVRVQSPKRWGPFSPGATVITPDVECPEGFKCKRSCEHYDCFEKIMPEKVAQEIVEKLRG